MNYKCEDKREEGEARVLWECRTGDPDLVWGWGGGAQVGLTGPSGEWEPLKGFEQGPEGCGRACKYT